MSMKMNTIEKIESFWTNLNEYTIYYLFIIYLFIDHTVWHSWFYEDHIIISYYYLLEKQNFNDKTLLIPLIGS